MTSSEKRLKEFEARMNSGNPGVILGTIESLRSEDPFGGAIKIMAEIFDNTENQEIKLKIRDFMNDLKHLPARAEVIAEIRKSYKPSTTTMLVSSCWQSGLDYTDWMNDLATVFSTGDYAVALECFTVIEEFSSHLSRSKKNDIISILTGSSREHSPDKTALMHELVSVLS